jgi:hypothetical protein
MLLQYMYCIAIRRIAQPQKCVISFNLTVVQFPLVMEGEGGIGSFFV